MNPGVQGAMVVHCLVILGSLVGLAIGTTWNGVLSSMLLLLATMALVLTIHVAREVVGGISPYHLVRRLQRELADGSRSAARDLSALFRHLSSKPEACLTMVQAYISAAMMRLENSSPDDMNLVAARLFTPLRRAPSEVTQRPEADEAVINAISWALDRDYAVAAYLIARPFLYDSRLRLTQVVQKLISGLELLLLHARRNTRPNRHKARRIVRLATWLHTWDPGDAYRNLLEEVEVSHELQELITVLRSRPKRDLLTQTLAGTLALSEDWLGRLFDTYEQQRLDYYRRPGR